MRDEKIEHGGDLTQMRLRYPHVKAWVDVSTGINPHAYPLPDFAPADWHALPGRAALDALHDAAAAYYGVARDQLAAAPGTQSLIQWLPVLRQRRHGPGRAIIVSPTYGEHALSWARAGFEVSETPFDPNLQADVVVITHPNNPDAACVSLESLDTLAQSLADRNGWLVIDEAYVDADPRFSFAPFLPQHRNVIMLRSFGKFFGLAGVRLGFALTQAPRVSELQSLLGPWAVSGPACTLATHALRDTEWIVRTRAQLAALAHQRDAALQRAGLELIGSHPLFCLAQSLRAASIFETLARAGFYARRFAAHPEWLRFGVVPQAELERMEKALRESLHEAA